MTAFKQQIQEFNGEEQIQLKQGAGRFNLFARVSQLWDQYFKDKTQALIDSSGGGGSTLQAVLTAGNTSDQGININSNQIFVSDGIYYSAVGTSGIGTGNNITNTLVNLNADAPSLQFNTNGTAKFIQVSNVSPGNAVTLEFPDRPSGSYTIATSAYKVYTALVSQTGTSHPTSITNGTLTVGTTYQITSYQTGDDFTNVGAPNNNTGTYFVATGGDYGTPVTPTVWTNSSELTSDDGAPTVNILENTIGNIWFTYADVGTYFIYSDGVFILNKTFCHTVAITEVDATNFRVFSVVPANVPINLSLSSTLPLSELAVNNLLSYIPIEIRVYN